jgi:hypothetical protein
MSAPDGMSDGDGNMPTSGGMSGGDGSMTAPDGMSGGDGSMQAPGKMNGENGGTSASDGQNTGAQENDRSGDTAEAADDAASEKGSSSENTGAENSAPAGRDASDDLSSSGMKRGFEIETTTVYLPVGVQVYSGSKTAGFSILQAGDQLEVLFETDENGNEVITKIWITGTT